MDCRKFLYTGAYRGGKEAGHVVMLKETENAGLCPYTGCFASLIPNIPEIMATAASMPPKKRFWECYDGKNCRI
jgi:hypothetical protein